MRPGIFGWDLPPGAANDPNAPWNQGEAHHPDCPAGEDFDEEELLCQECGKTRDAGDCWLYVYLPYWLARLLSGAGFLGGLMPQHCRPDAECRCSDFDDDGGWGD